MTTITTEPLPFEPWDCTVGDGHFQAVSECCGAGENVDAQGFCGQCNESTGWECVVCGVSMNKEVYG